jgi:hypothetical protein
MIEKDNEQLDLVDEMNWEDSDKVEKISLEEAGLEEENDHVHGVFHSNEGSLYNYLAWYYDDGSSIGCEFDGTLY